jgi:hypothetical protein
MYYCDALHGLRVLAKLGYEDDERVRDAVHLILANRSPDGKWLLEGDWSREPEAQENKRKALIDVEELWKPKQMGYPELFQSPYRNRRPGYIKKIVS